MPKIGLKYYVELHYWCEYNEFVIFSKLNQRTV